MPKPTSDYKAMIDYQEAVTGKDKGQVYFGTRSHTYWDKKERAYKPRYSEALNRYLNE